MTKLTRQEKDGVFAELTVPRYAGYCDCVLGTKIGIRLTNRNGRSVRVKVTGRESELFLPFEKEAEIDFESAVKLEADGILSPRFLAENDAPRTFTFHADIFCDGERIRSAEAEITALPFDHFEGLSGVPEKVACFVRPRAFQTARVLKEARRRLVKWGVPDFQGYENADRSAVRKAVAAIFSAVKEMGFTKEGEFDLSRPAPASPPSLTAARKADAFRLALFAAACLERAGLHAVLALSESRVGVGAWLFDSCFLESSSDDFKTVERYLSDGVNHLAFFEAEDLFVDGGAAFPDSAERFMRGLKAGRYERFVDIARCRLSGFAPCPTRGAGESGYEIYGAASAPPPVPEFKPSADKRLPKNKLWERGLLDFSSRNPLLDFKGKNALSVLAPDADILAENLRGEGMRLTGGGRESAFGYERELLLLEEKKGILRTPLSARETDALAAGLRRRNRESFEETGAKVLFLACGFLKYGNGDERSAPVVLLPAELTRAKGKEGYNLSSSGEPFVNLTLVEFLKEEYNVDLRGIENAAHSVKEILAVVRKETASMKGWEVKEEICLSVFSFQRFLMWNDVKRHFEEFRKNRAVEALLTGKTREEAPASEETGGEETEEPLPLPSDCSQRAALRLLESGKSFVLQGPPGTGKSQTITNMIALALSRGKSVLFVAEKQAAIGVVRRRLDEIGIGEFCLELGSGADDGEALEKLNAVSRLQADGRDGEDASFAEEFKAAKRELQANADALFKQRKFALSAHGAIAEYFKRREYPDVLKIDGGFFGQLDGEKLAEYRERILLAASAAKECGGVFNSPFGNVNLKEYSPAVRDRAVLAGRALLGEAAHFKCFLALVLDFFNQRISAFTEERANALAQIIGGLLSGKYGAYFENATKEEFFRFRSANVRLDRCMAFCEKHFRLLIDPVREAEEWRKWLLSGGERLSGTALSVKKRLERAALHPLADKDVPKYAEAVLGVSEARQELAEGPFAKHVTERGRISEKKRKAFLAPLKELSVLCASVFAEWSPERFFEGCIRAQNGCAAPVFGGFLAAKESFFRVREQYFAATAAERERIRGEDVLGYCTAKAAALLENADLLSGRCAYKKAEEELVKRGMKFIGDAFESGSLSPDDALGGFEKSLLEYFLSSVLSADPRLARMTSESAESEKEKFSLLAEKETAFARRKLRSALIQRLPAEGQFREERALLFRLGKGTRRGRLRALLSGAPAFVKKLCPCLMLSPDAAAQYLVPRANEYDIVIFDEASQMTTAEAIPALARAKQAVIVGDNRQLPPTSFFRTAFSEEEEAEPLESVLDEALAAGFEERSLLWHYRSRHESLIAFSNAVYYGNRLNTFPSPVALESRVRLQRVEGVYDRGGTKRNRKEAEALVREVVRRLQDEELSGLSMGVVTFSEVQRDEIERLLAREIAKRSLEEVAYGRREPLFVKNLESVQGDERDVIFFSVCYGRDASGKLSYNFGALNRAGGWRRLNVACSRAREEMIVFSSIVSSEIDLGRTSSKGVEGLKAFLEFAEKGRATLALPANGAPKRGIGEFLAKDLSAYGYECRTGVGAGNFKLEAAVLDPKDENRYILGILSDGTEEGSAADRAALLPAVLGRGGWNLLSVSSVAYFNNPKREIKRIKDVLDKLTGAGAESGLARYFKPYRRVRSTGGKTAAFVTDGRNDGEIEKRLLFIVEREEPISRAFLKKRCLESFGIVRAGQGAQDRLDELVTRLNLPFERVGGREYFYKNPRSLLPVKFRKEGTTRRRKTEEDFTPFETAALIKGILEEKVTLYDDELSALVASVCGVPETDAFSAFVAETVAYGENKGMFRRALSGRISLA